MPCRSPLQAYHKAGGGITFSRKETFGPAWAYAVSCGMCRDCRIRRKREWAVRCYHEASLHAKNCWVNPTYALDPITVNRRDYQIFFKNLRNHGFRFRYFGCAEYGSKLSRPHGHICLFGMDFIEDQYPWKKIDGRLYYRSPTLEKCWIHGHCLVTTLSGTNAGYTAGYVQKKINGDKAEDHYTRTIGDQVIQVAPEFGMMSRRPGLGEKWIEKYYKETYPADFVVFNGKEVATPRYYDKWLKAKHPDLWVEVLAKRLQKINEAPKQTQKEMAMQAHARDVNNNFHNRRNYENQTDTP